jgi:antitoxin component YwqK of YwqJK toxin-antitoxin module
MTEVKRTYHFNGSLHQEWFEINGKKNGDFKSYYDNGQLGCIFSYIDDKINGHYKTYEKYGGKPIEHYIYENGEKKCALFWVNK